MDTIANRLQIGYVGSLQRSQGDASGDLWFTPLKFVEDVRTILGGIDLDPFSSDEANGEIGVRSGILANRYFDRESNALVQKWHASSVFMNPPYSRGLCAKACAKFVDEWRKRRFARGIVLVNNMTDTRWFHQLLEPCSAICLINRRLKFVTPDAKRVSGNTRGQIALLFARPRTQLVGKFRKHMSADWGRVFVNGEGR